MSDQHPVMDPRPVTLDALFRPQKKVEPPAAGPPPVNWKQKHQDAKARASQKLAEAEARHQEEINKLKAELDTQRKLATEVVTELDKAFSQAIGQLVAEATAKILNSNPPISRDTMASLVEEVMQSLPDGVLAVLHHAPSIDPAILSDLPGVSLQADPLLSDTTLHATIGVGAISTSLARRIEELSAEIMQA